MRFAAALAVLGLLTGCAQRHLTHEPGLVASWNRSQPLPDAPAPPLTLIIHTRYLDYDKPSDPSAAKWWSKHKVRHQLEEVLSEFPCLKRAQLDGVPLPYRLEIEATHAVRGNNTLRWISTSTYTVIPNTTTGFIELDAVVSHNGRALKTYSATGTYRTTRQALLALLPMLWRYKVPADTMEDTFRDLLLQIQRDAGELFKGAA